MFVAQIILDSTSFLLYNYCDINLWALMYYFRRQKMKKKILALLLAALLCATCLLTSCSQETDIPVTPAKVYTLYTIAEEGTTAEGIRAVELALNRLVFYRLGFCVKLIMVPEDEYDQLIADKLAELEEYNSNKGGSSSSSSASCEESDVVLTGEVLLDRLDQGIDLETDRPRLDIFLVRGSEQYLEFIEKGYLTKLNEKLGAEGKALKDNIYPTFFTAATINKNIYGVPMNTGIGEYEYMVFDTELLQKYGKDAASMQTLEDLEDYLAEIKANEPDVVPLQKASASQDFSFLFSDGFPAYVDDDYVISALEDDALNSYYAMIAKYASLGYIPETVDESQRFAVTFVKGDLSDIEALSKQTGYTYTQNVYNMPKATDDNTLQNLFCISKYCVSDDLTNVIEFLTLLETDSEIQNILTFGVENTHYQLEKYVDKNDNSYDQVKLLDAGELTYRTKREYTGNAYKTYTMVGEDPLMWENMKKQNLDSVASVDLGFGFTLDSFELEDEEILYGPDYIEIIENVMSEHYGDYLNGVAGKADYNAFKAENDAAIRQQLNDSLVEQYTDELTASYEEEITASYSEGGANYDKLHAEAVEAALDGLATSLKSKLRTELTEKFREELGEDATDAEVNAKVNELLDDPEYMRQQVQERCTQEEIDEKTATEFDKKLSTTLRNELAAISETESYKAELNALLSGSQFAEDLKALIESDYEKAMLDSFEAKLLENVKAYSMSVLEECNKAIEDAVNAFIEENKDKLGLTEMEILQELGFEKAPEEESEDEEGEESGDESSEGEESGSESSEGEESGDESSEGEEGGESTAPTDDPLNDVNKYFRVVLVNKITEQFYSFNGDPDDKT